MRKLIGTSRCVRVLLIVVVTGFLAVVVWAAVEIKVSDTRVITPENPEIIAVKNLLSLVARCSDQDGDGPLTWQQWPWAFLEEEGRQVFQCGQHVTHALGWTKTPGTFNVVASCPNHGQATATVKIVGLRKLDYKIADGDFAPVKGTIYALKGTQVTFKAFTDPEGYPWPIAQPEWLLNDETTGTTGVEVKPFTFSTKSPNVATPTKVTAKCGNGVDANVVVYEVHDLEYRIGAADWATATGTIKVGRGTEVQFRVALDPAGVPWPTGKPVWGGSAAGSPAEPTASVAFNEVSTSATDLRTVTAECGDTVDANVLVCDIKDFQYREAGETTWVDVPTGNISVPKGTTLEFRATIDPPDATWPSGKPVWTGATGTGDVRSATFHTVSSSVSSPETVQVECGSTRTANVVVCGVDLEYKVGEDEWTATPNPVSVMKGAAMQFHARIKPEGALWPSGEPTWSGSAGISGTGETKATTFNTTSADTSDYNTVTVACGDSEATCEVLVYHVDITSISPTSDLALGSDLTVNYSIQPADITLSDVRLLVRDSSYTTVYERTGIPATGGNNATAWVGAKWSEPGSVPGDDHTGAYANPSNGDYSVSISATATGWFTFEAEPETINTTLKIEAQVRDNPAGGASRASGLADLADALEVKVTRGATTHTFDKNDFSLTGVGDLSLSHSTLDSLANGDWTITLEDVRDEIGNFYDKNPGGAIDHYQWTIRIR